MANDLVFGIRLTADGSAMVGTVKVAKQEIDGLGNSAKAAGGSVGLLEQGFAKLAPYFTVGAIAAWANSLTHAAAELKDLATITGSPIESLSRLSNIAIVSGQGTDLLRLGLERLSYTMNSADLEATRGQKALQQFGISAKDPAAAMQELANKLALYADGTSKAALVQDVMGRGAQNLLPLLAKMAEAHDINATVTERQAQEAERLEQNWRRLTSAGSDFKTMLLDDVVPSLANAIEQFREGTRIAGGFWEALRIFGLGTSPFGSLNEQLKETRTELGYLNVINSNKSTLQKWFDDTFGSNTQKQLDDTTKKLQFLNLLQRQSLGPLDDPSNYDARDIRARQRPDSGYKSPALGGSQGDATLAGTFAYFQALQQAEADSAKRILQIETDSNKDLLDQLNNYHALGLISEQTFIDASSDLAKSNAQANVDAAKGLATSFLNQLSEVYDQATKTPKEAQDRENQLVGILEKLTQARFAAGRAENALFLVQSTHDQATALALQKQEDALTAITRAGDDYTRNLHDQTDELTFQASLIGRTQADQDALNATRKLEVGLRDQVLTIERQIQDLRGKDPAQVAALRAEQERLTASTAQTVVAIKDGTAALDEQRQHQQGLSDAWQGMNTIISGAFDHTKGGWRDVMQYLTDSVKSTLTKIAAEFAAQKLALPVFISLGGNAGALGSNPFPTLNAFGGLFGSGGGIAGPTGETGDALTAAFGGTTSALSGLTGIIGPALPLLGAALALAGSLFKSSPSATKGQFQISGGTSGFEDNAFTSSKFGNLGFADQGTQQFSGQAAQVFNKLIAGTLDAIAARLTPNQIKTAAGALQGIHFPGQEGTFSTEDFLQKYGGDVLKRVVGTALGVLSPALGELIDGFQGTADEVTSFANSILALHDAASGDPLQDAADAFKKTQESSTETLRRMGQNVVTLARQWDGTTASTNALTTATLQYRQGLAQEYALIQQVTGAIHDMFGQTREQIEFAGLTAQEAFNLDQSKADILFAALQQSDDPKAIQDYATKINSYFTDAFGRLSPEEQLADKQDFLTHLAQLDKDVNDRLASLGATLGTDSKDPFEAVRVALGEVATKEAATADVNAATVAQFGGYVASLGAILSNIQIAVDVRGTTSTSEVG
jgi:hypothetical protein